MGGRGEGLLAVRDVDAEEEEDDAPVAAADKVEDLDVPFLVSSIENSGWLLAEAPPRRDEET